MKTYSEAALKKAFTKFLELVDEFQEEHAKKVKAGAIPAEPQKHTSKAVSVYYTGEPNKDPYYQPEYVWVDCDVHAKLDGLLLTRTFNKKTNKYGGLTVTNIKYFRNIRSLPQYLYGGLYRGKRRIQTEPSLIGHNYTRNNFK